MRLREVYALPDNVPDRRKRNEAGTAIRFADVQALGLAGAAALLPLCADLLGVCDGSDRTPWRTAGQLAGSRKAIALSPVCARRVGSATRAISGRAVPGNTRPIELLDYSPLA